jgi:hypothetical protein
VSGAAVAPLLGCALAVLVMVTGCLLAARGVLVDVAVEEGDLTVRPRGARWLFALRREVRAPLRAVTSVEVVDPKSVRLGLRMPGTALPGVLLAGSYGTGAERTFVLVGRARRVLLVGLSEGRHRRLLVQVADPDAAAAAIEMARATAV